MANDENKIILEFPATSIEIDLGETITFDNISGFLNSDRVTYNDESLTEEITHLENDKADKTYVDEELNKKADKDTTYTKIQTDEKFAAKTDLEHIPPELGFIKTLQRFDKTRILDNTGINGSTGNFNNDSNYWVSNFIGIDAETSKVITNEAANGLYFYSDNSYLGRVTSVPANTTIDIPYPTATRLCLRYSKSYTPIIKAKDIILSFGEVLSPTKEMYILQDIVSVKEDIVEINDKLNLIDRNYETRQVIATETMSAGDFIYLDVPDIKKNNQIGFHAIVSTLGKIVLSHGQSQSYSAAKIEVDNTNIYVYGYLANAWTLYNTIAHGLTISNNIDIAIDVNNNLTANISVSSNGSVFVKEGVIWNGNSQFVQADIESGEYKNCILTFDCPDYNKALWVFGDSYLDMWPQILAVNGIDDYYLDGFSGRNSVAALASFEKAIQFGRPKKLAWFLGMNDRDGKIVNGVSDATGINANWLATFTAVKNWCDNNNVELIACTIPEVPARDHTYKNAYIKSLGIRYVDVAGVVGATTLGSHWYNYGQANAYLANDEVHPSKPYGRNTIAYKMLVDMPEMISDIKMSTYTNGEIDALFLLKADKTTTYTKTQVDNLITNAVSEAIYNILPDDTASGSVANFNTSLEMPIKSLDIDVNAVQEAETPTPATPLPISGWSAVSLYQRGANLFNKATVINGYYIADTDGIAKPDANSKCTDFIEVKGGATYAIMTEQTSGGWGAWYDKDKNYISGITGFAKATPTTYTAPSNAFFARLTCYRAGVGNIDTFAFNTPSTATTYEPYAGTTEVINLGGTYYGGYFTQDKAGHRQFVVDYVKRVLTDKTKWKSRTSSTYNYVYDDTITADRLTGDSTSYLMCNIFQVLTSSQSVDYCRWSGANTSLFAVQLNTISLQDLQDFTENYGVEICYKIATPIVIDLPDGDPITTLVGTNNIYADTGDTSVVFKSSVADFVNAHSGGGGAKNLGGVFLGGSNNNEEETDEGEEPKEEIKTIGDTKKLGGD